MTAAVVLAVAEGVLSSVINGTQPGKLQLLARQVESYLMNS